ncbi:hypothetical protein F4560_007188 [Saccharothrix ecbatanensis]|uniref:DUF397 domain-containing protein n=1 Tax=Saccharothrix ecbatanensis TaxID=1105145 RepID=A0A7W9HS09_9PSEU|nr:DUF397 domain-containing protein [Saccharothrix ecbatanensis]MBB5807420.1 hypothetical protein [Saccharothrix ecbatanensis]
MIENWRTSTYTANNGTCVETGWTGDVVGYRDTKQAALPGDERPTLTFGKGAAHAFLTMIKSSTR